MGRRPLRPPRKYTVADCRTWPDDERWELIDGVAYAMTPPNRWHSLVTSGLSRFLLDFFHSGPCEVHIGNLGVRFPHREEPDDDVETLVIPDLVVVCDHAKLDAQGCRGAPELIVEIVSPRNAAQDKLRKLNLYERQKVPEYWLFTPDGVLWVFRLQADGRYGRPEGLDRTMKLSTPQFPGLVIDLDQVFPPDPPREVREPPKPYADRP